MYRERRKTDGEGSFPDVEELAGATLGSLEPVTARMILEIFRTRRYGGHRFRGRRGGNATHDYEYSHEGTAVNSILCHPHFQRIYIKTSELRGPEAR